MTFCFAAHPRRLAIAVALLLVTPVALAAGVPYATVIAAIDLAAAVNAGVTLRTAIEGAKQAGVGAACEGAECVVGVAKTG
jgi:hypothetical protein